MNLRNGRRSALESGSGDDDEEETDPKMIQKSESTELVELLDVRVKKREVVLGLFAFLSFVFMTWYMMAVLVG